VPEPTATLQAPALADLTVRLAWLLLGAALLGMLARWVRVPYAVVLVLAGLLVEESHLVAVPRLEPDLLLFVFLPPLLFDASFRIDAHLLRRLVRPVLWLAVPGTLLTALIVGAVVAWAVGLPLGVALLFGSIVAATDPVAVVSVFARLRAPERLTVVAEAESLVNDGMAITLYTVLLGLALTGQAEPAHALVEFTREVGVGVAVGVGLGFTLARVNRLVDDHLVEMTLSTALAYGSYLIAMSIGGSGALACVAAGLVHGSYGRQVGMSEHSGARLDDLWEYLGFLANGLLFLLVGFSADLSSLARSAVPVCVAILAVLFARVVVIELAARVIPGRWRGLDERERVVLVWGGLRGALTIALALALPAATPQRDLLIVLAFGVVLFTLVVQGLTLTPLLLRLGLARRD
jgi:CPA1 family monovalent cation:H+ antiporter